MQFFFSPCCRGTYMKFAILNFSKNVFWIFFLIYLNLHGGRGQGSQFLSHTLANTHEHRCAARKNNLNLNKTTWKRSKNFFETRFLIFFTLKTKIFFFKKYVRVEVLTDINIALHDTAEGGVVNTFFCFSILSVWKKKKQKKLNVSCNFQRLKNFFCCFVVI